MGKWSQFEKDNGSSDDKETKSDEAPPKNNSAADKTEKKKTGKESKQKVVDEMVHLRDTVSGALENARKHLPKERIKDLEDAQGTIDGAVGQISPKDALANQQQESQSMGMGMGGGSRSSEDDDE